MTSFTYGAERREKQVMNDGEGVSFAGDDLGMFCGVCSMNLGFQ